MSSGGYRPGAGRKPGAKDSKPRKPRKQKRASRAKTKPTDMEREQIKKALSFDLKAKAAMYQDFLIKISKGQKLTLAEKRIMVKIGAELAGEVKDEKQPTEKTGELREDKLPLDYMLNVMNDPTELEERRDRMACAAAPYCHPRKGEGIGKKDEKMDKAKQAGSGKFAAGKSPISLVK